MTQFPVRSNRKSCLSESQSKDRSRALTETLEISKENINVKQEPKSRQNARKNAGL